MFGHLCIFLRTPQLGEVKRRLARDLGDEGALSAYCQLVDFLLPRVCANTTYTSELWVSGGLEHPMIQKWALHTGRPPMTQAGGDLGQKMQHTFVNRCADDRPIVLIGSDVPVVNRTYIEQAFTALQDCDLVLGPAEDGGYGLIGMRQAYAPLFSGVEWGSSKVYAQTLQRAKTLGLNVTSLATVWDVDHLVQWQRFLAMID